MKMLVTALALTIATPALAQNAAPADPHAGHSTATAHSTDHAMHEQCKAMKAKGEKGECPMHAGKAAADPHAGHAMGKADPHASHAQKPD